MDRASELRILQEKVRALERQNAELKQARRPSEVESELQILQEKVRALERQNAELKQ